MRTSAEMERIRNNILKIMTGYHWLTPIYNTTNQWDWRKANRWEQILNEIYTIMLGMSNWYVYGGVARGGQPRLWQHRFRKWFQEMTYIEASGGQYINTGYYANNNTRIETKVMPINISQGEAWQCVFSSKTSYLVNEFVVQVNNNNQKWYSAFGNVTDSGFLSVADNTIYTIDKNKNVTTINGTTSTLTDNSFEATQPGYIFADNENGATHFFRGRIYYLKIYDNGVLVKDFVPAIDGNGIACFYEKIDKILYYNQGTGSFTAEIILNNILTETGQILTTESGEELEADLI